MRRCFEWLSAKSALLTSDRPHVLDLTIRCRRRGEPPEIQGRDRTTKPMGSYFGVGEFTTHFSHSILVVGLVDVHWGLTDLAFDPFGDHGTHEIPRDGILASGGSPTWTKALVPEIGPGQTRRTAEKLVCCS